MATSLPAPILVSALPGSAKKIFPSRRHAVITRSPSTASPPPSMGQAFSTQGPTPILRPGSNLAPSVELLIYKSRDPCSALRHIPQPRPASPAAIDGPQHWHTVPSGDV